MCSGVFLCLGEVDEIVGVFECIYGEIYWFDSGGFIEGGDILVIECEIFVGLFLCIDIVGVVVLEKIVMFWGYKLCELYMFEGVLYFKIDCFFLDEEIIFLIKWFLVLGCFEGYCVLYVVDGEEVCVNFIWFNDIVILLDGFFKIMEMFVKEGYDVCLIGNIEVVKVDGGMLCLLLRFMLCG